MIISKSAIKGLNHRRPPVWASLGAQMVKFLPAMWETWVQFLGWEDPDWRREWQPTPVFLPGEFHGQRNLEGYNPWGGRVRHD